MGIVSDFREYLSYRPQYRNWKENREEKEAKRLAYIDRNNLSDKDKQREGDVKRAKAVLNAVDIMDEYSQTRAEEMELTTQQIKSLVAQPATYLGMALGGLFCHFSKFGKQFSSKFKDSATGVIAFAAAAGMIGALISNALMSIWGNRKEIEASRTGRMEAMQKELSDVKQFAQLTQEQEEKRDEIAKTINITQKEAKKMNIAGKGGIGILSSLKLLRGGESDIELAKIEYNKQLSEEEKQIENISLTPEEELEAKRDQQLIQNIVEKIDIASQDYAEDAELATSIIEIGFMGAGGLSGVLTSFIAKHFKSKYASLIGAAIGVAVAIGGAAWATKFQKQASRVARFKVKQDFMKNPQKLFYVDDAQAENEDGTKFREQSEKRNIFKFLKQLISDNKEYNDYHKDENIKQKQRVKAQSQIELTPEQETRARQLQQNVFKTFNRVDGKSQKYAESTEALGEIVQNIVTTIAMIPMTISTYKFIDKTGNAGVSQTKLFSRYFGTLAFIMVPAVILNKIITSEQKMASRVADMRVIDEMSDCRYFADLSSGSLAHTDAFQTSQNAKTSQNSQTGQTSPVSQNPQSPKTPQTLQNSQSAAKQTESQKAAPALSPLNRRLIETA